MTHRQVTNPQTTLALVKERRAIELRITGATYAQIADELGYASKGPAHKAVIRGLRRWGTEPAEELRKLEAARLDAATAAIWPKVEEGDLPAIAVYLRISARRARMLGLDPPQEFRGTLTVGLLEEEATRLERELAQRGVDRGALRALPSPPAADGAPSPG